MAQHSKSAANENDTTDPVQELKVPPHTNMPATHSHQTLLTNQHYDIAHIDGQGTAVSFILRG